MKINGIELKYGMRVEIDKWNDIKIYDKNNNILYYETSSGLWAKQEYDKNNNKIYHECSDGFWIKRKFDKNNNEVYYENSNGHWAKRKYDENNNKIYREGSDGVIEDNRFKYIIIIDGKEIELSKESFKSLKNSLKI